MAKGQVLNSAIINNVNSAIVNNVKSLKSADMWELKPFASSLPMITSIFFNKL